MSADSRDKAEEVVGSMRRTLFPEPLTDLWYDDLVARVKKALEEAAYEANKSRDAEWETRKQWRDKCFAAVDRAERAEQALLELLHEDGCACKDCVHILASLAAPSETLPEKEGRGLQQDPEGVRGDGEHDGGHGTPPARSVAAATETDDCSTCGGEREVPAGTTRDWHVDCPDCGRDYSQKVTDGDRASSVCQPCVRLVRIEAMLEGPLERPLAAERAALTAPDKLKAALEEIALEGRSPYTPHRCAQCDYNQEVARKALETP